MRKVIIFFLLLSFNVFPLNGQAEEQKAFDLTLQQTDIEKLSEENEHFTGLPFFKEEATKRGYALEPPLVLSVQYVSQRQFAQQQEGSLTYINIKTENLFNVPGINLKLNSDGTPNILVTSEKSEEKTVTKGVRAGVWVLPFLQVYGLVNEIKGETNTYTTSLTQLELPASGLGLAAELALRAIFRSSYLGNGLVKTSENVKLSLDGTNFGGGFVLAGGYENYFFLTDINYTYTDFDFANDNTKTFVVSARVGYNTTLLNRPFRFWGGLMGQYVSSEITGKLNALKFEGLTGALVGAIDPNSEASFVVKQELVSPINFIAGARYTFTPYTALLVEGGYAGEDGRSSILVTFELLF